jgi:hypothetical protein
MRLNVQLDIEAARRDFRQLGNEVNKAAGRTLQRVAVTTRLEANRLIRDRLSLKSGTVRNALSIRRPFGNKTLIRDVVATGKPIPLKEYNAKATRRGVTFRIGKGKRRQVYSRLARKGFINPKFGNGHVFVRITPDPPGKERARIKKVFGPSITQGFVAKRTRERMLTVARLRWSAEFARELRFRAERVANRAAGPSPGL